MSAPLVTVDRRDDGVALVTLENPPLNLVTRELTRRLLDTAEALAGDATVRAVVIAGAGTRAFCAGADVHEFATVRDAVVRKKLERENAALSAVAALPVPTIAAIHAVALGGGAELAIACDLRIVDADAVIGFPEILLGVFPGAGGVFRLPRIVGASHALDLLYSGRRIGADEALRIGLANEVAPHGHALDRALELAATLASRPSLALSLIKSGVNAAFAQTTNAAVAQTLRDSASVFSGPDIEEGLAAFFARRAPRFVAPRPVPAAAAPVEPARPTARHATSKRGDP